MTSLDLNFGDREELAADLVPGTDVCTLRDLSPSSPFRRVDWRWILASNLARGGSSPRHRWIDDRVRKAANFLRKGDRSAGSRRSKSSASDPVIAAAVALRAESSRATRLAIEALLLAGLDDLAISALVDVSPEIVAAYHDLHFEVRPLLAHSDAVMARVFGLRLYTQGLDHELAVKLLAFIGGPFVAEALVRAVVIPSSLTNAGVDLGGVAESLEFFVLASSLPVDDRTLSFIVRLNARADEIARDPVGATVACVTKPVAIEALDARILAELGEPVRETGPIVASACAPERTECSPMRAECAPQDVFDGPDAIDVNDSPTSPASAFPLGIAG